MTTQTTRLYGASIALVSGLYVLLSAAGGTGMMGSSGGLLVSLLGVGVVVHGVVLLTPAADRLGRANGPLMIAYALLLLLNQLLVGVTGTTNWGMGSGMTGGMGSGMTGGSGTTMLGGMGPGMVALALLMLVSGLIMTNDADGT